MSVRTATVRFGVAAWLCGAFVSASDQPIDKVWPSDGVGQDEFGAAVATNGSVILVGATGSSTVYAYDALTRSELYTIPSPGTADDSFGFRLVASGDRVIVSAHSDSTLGQSSGRVYVYDVSTGSLERELVRSDPDVLDLYGFAVGLEGDTAVVASVRDDDNGIDAGAVYVFDVTTGAELHKLLPSDGTPSDGFGSAVAVFGTTAVVAAPREKTLGNDSGAVYVFDTQTGQELDKIVPADGAQGDQFGTSVALHGTTLLVGAIGDDDQGNLSGSAYAFDVSTGSELAKMVAADGDSNDWFGWSVALNGSDRAVIGALRDEDNGNLGGAAYTFQPSTGTQLQKLDPISISDGDLFGTSVALDEVRVVVGAPEDSVEVDSGSISIYAAPCPPIIYCGGKTSSAGCLATISTSDLTASPTSGANDYAVLALNVQELKNGLLFGSPFNLAFLPFNGGILCVAPPLKRGPIVNSGGASPNGCAGTFSTIVNDGLTFPSGLDAGTGNPGWYQYWYRDPQNGVGQLGTALSNAVELNFD